MPGAGELEKALEGLVRDPGRRSRLGLKAWETAREAFCLERWRASWREVLEEVARG
jgi:hypothetical protein